MLLQSDEQRAETLMRSARSDAAKRWQLYQQMAAIQYGAVPMDAPVDKGENQ